MKHPVSLNPTKQTGLSIAFPATLSKQALAIAVGCCLSLPINSRAASIIGLGDIPGGAISSTAFAVSNDGLVVVGSSTGPNGEEAFRWSSATGIVGLGYLPGGSSIAGTFCRANGVSADGSVIVGSSINGNNREEAFRWTQATGMVGLGDVVTPLLRSMAYDITPDGSVIVGRGSSHVGVEGVIYQGGIMTALPRAADGGAMIAEAVSSDGNSAAGGSGTTFGAKQQQFSFWLAGR